MDWLIAFDAQHPLLIYGLAFIGMYVEGDIMLLLLGALSRGRYVSFFGMFVVAFIATIVHDIIFWKIGERLGRLKRKKYLYFNLEKITQYMERMRKWAGLYVVFSKFAWNFNRVVLVGLGYIGIPLRRVVKFSLISAIMWPLLYMSIGFVFADQTELFKQRIEVVGLIIAGIIVLIILFELYIRKMVMKVFFSNNSSSQADIRELENKD
jgi:membrane protein DedA with SNARE-associated domain